MAGERDGAVLTGVLMPEYRRVTRARKVRPRAVLECHRAQSSLWMTLRRELTADCGGANEPVG